MALNCIEIAPRAMPVPEDIPISLIPINAAWPCPATMAL